MSHVNRKENIIHEDMPYLWLSSDGVHDEDTWQRENMGIFSIVCNMQINTTKHT